MKRELLPEVRALIVRQLGKALADEWRRHAPLEHDRVVEAEGRKISVLRELSAWRWVLERIPVWTQAMHDFMTRCINSYATYADDAEKAAIAELCSPMTYYTTRQRAAKEF